MSNSKELIDSIRIFAEAGIMVNSLQLALDKPLLFWYNIRAVRKLISLAFGEKI
jgi:hypothetical protein